MQATTVTGIVIESSQTRDGICVLTTQCHDYAEYARLPKVVRCTPFGRGLFGLTGWNSDRNMAYYRDDAYIAFPH